MNFRNKHYISGGVDSKVNPLLQFIMWQCIDDMPSPKDYLQVFELSVKSGKQKITHIQEEPEYQREYLIIELHHFVQTVQKRMPMVEYLL